MIPLNMRLQSSQVLEMESAIVVSESSGVGAVCLGRGVLFGKSAEPWRWVVAMHSSVDALRTAVYLTMVRQ